MHRRPTFRRALALTAIAGIGIGSLAACGDDDDAGTDATEAAPEDHKAPMAEVLAGLPTIVQDGVEAAALGAIGDYQGALDTYEELHEVWEDIEGTIKDTDRDLYERIETAQGLIKDGAENDNSERIQQGADDQAVAAAEFISAQGGAATSVTVTP